MKRLNNKHLIEKFEEYDKYFEGDKKQIAYELAKDFIYNAQLEFEHYLNREYKTYWTDVLKDRANLWEQAINETAEYLKD